VEEVVLPGGVANKGAVVRVGDTVRRPARPQSAATAALLGHLESVGFERTPRFLGFDDQGREVLSWIPGEAPLPPFPGWSMSNEALLSVARLVRAYHDAVEGFSISEPGASWSADLADPYSQEVVCHNDVCPENVVFRDDEAVGLLDFDFAAPGRRLWDVVGTLTYWAPITAPEWRRSYPLPLDAVERVALFADAYGLSAQEREGFTSILRSRWEVGRTFVRGRLQAGEPAFIDMVAEHGAEDRWAATDRWLEIVGSRLETRLCGA
jgi:hypothetical protein